MAVVQAQKDPLAEIRRFVKEKPEQFKASMEAWCKKQPAWVEGVVLGVQGSFQVRRRHGGPPAVMPLRCPHECQPCLPLPAFQLSRGNRPAFGVLCTLICHLRACCRHRAAGVFAGPA